MSGFFNSLPSTAGNISYDNTDTPQTDATTVQDAIDDILTGTAVAAEKVFYIPNTSESSSPNVQVGLDLAFFRANRLPIVQSSWDSGTAAVQEPAAPGPEDGEVGGFWIAADYPGGDFWPPQLYGPKQEDDSWPLLTNMDYQFVSIVPDENIPAIPQYAWYTDPEDNTFIYAGTIITEPEDGATLTWSAAEHRWVTDIELTPLLSGINQTASTSYMLQYSDRFNTVCTTSNDPVEIVVPYEGFEPGTKIDIVQLGSGQVSIVGEGVSILIVSSQTLNLRTLFSAATLICIEEYAWLLVGDLEIAE